MPTPSNSRTRWFLLTVVGALLTAVASVLLLPASAHAATAIPAGFEFPHFGTVVVSGEVAESLNYTVYEVDNPACTGTEFPGTDDSCVPQTAVDTLVIPAGSYSGATFTVDRAPTCGPAQQDVYAGAYQEHVGAEGHPSYVAGGLAQLGPCATPTAPTTPTTPSSPTSTPSSTSTPTSTPATSAPPQPEVTPTDGAVSPVAAVPAVTEPVTPQIAGVLANTGAGSTGLLLALGVAALVAGIGIVVLGGRRRPRSRH